MKEENKLFDNWLLASSIALIAYLIYRLTDQAKMLWYFPLDFANDVSSYMAQLHFLKVCGFHQACPYWYNGFVTFKFSPPGWYFINYPLYSLWNNVHAVTYISMVLMLISGFLIFYYLGRLAKLSKIKRIAFFALFFGNASAIGNFIRLGRVHELLSWLFFIILFFMLYYYNDKKIDKKFYLTGVLYSLVILSYHSTGVLASFLWLGFLLTRETAKERIKTIFSSVLGLALSSFWLIPFVANIFHESAIPYLKQGTWIWNLAINNLWINISALVAPLACLILFYLYYKGSNRDKKNLLFFLPTIIFAFLFLIRVTPLFPIFNQMYPDPIVHYLFFFSIFFLLSLDLKALTTKRQQLLFKLIFLVSVTSIIVSLTHTPLFHTPDTQIDKEFISYIPLLNERFVIVGNNTGPVYSRAYYSFAATMNKNSISGWYPEEKSYSYISRLSAVHSSFNQGNCTMFKEELAYFNTTEVLAIKPFCERLKGCNLKEVKSGNSTCLYHI